MADKLLIADDEHDITDMLSRFSASADTRSSAPTPAWRPSACPDRGPISYCWTWACRT